jgi:hypothetical protein
MKRLLLAAALLAPLPAAAQPAATKLYSSSAEVQALIAKAKAEHKDGNTVELVVNAKAIRCSWNIAPPRRRPAFIPTTPN